MVTGALLLVAATLMVVPPKEAPWAGGPLSRRSTQAGWAVLGTAAGLLSGLSGIGGGVFVAPALIVLGWARSREAAGLSAPFILGNSIAGLAGALLSGQQLAPEFPLFAAVALLGAALGVVFTRRLSERAIRLVLAGIRSRVFSLSVGRFGLRSLRYWMLLTFGQSGFAMLFPRSPLPRRGVMQSLYPVISALGVGVAVALGLFSAARFYLVSWLGERITADLRNAVYSHVLRQSPQFFETTQTGEVLSRLTTDTTLVQTVVGSSLSLGLRNGVMGLGALAMLVWTNPYVMLQVLLIVVLVVVPSMWFGRRVRKLSRASQDRVADSSAIAAEVLNAIPIVQSYTAEDREARRFNDSTESAFQTAVRRTRARAGLVAFIIISTAALLLWGLYQGTQAVLAGTISPGHLGQTVVYIIIFAGAVGVLGEVYGDLLRAAGATERLMELLHAPSAIFSPANPAVTPVPAAGSAIRFDAVTFHYPSRPGTPALRDFSLDVAPGETVALVGSSGAGKSTVFRLLLRFYDPQAGRVLMDGVDLREAEPAEVRARLALVAQESPMFSGSALDNIRYGREAATEDEVRAVVRAAQAETFLAALPEGLNTSIGEKAR
eukprot:gene38326-50305_t